MKKKVAIFLCVLMMVIACAIPAFAAQSATMSLKASDTKLDLGETVTLTVSVSKVENCTNGGFVFLYNKNVFEYVGGEALSGADGYNAGVSTTGGNVAGYFMNGKKTVEGELFKITLKVKTDAPYGDYEITGEPNMTAGEKLDCAVNKVTITVACKHSYRYEQVDDNVHKHICTKCGDSSTEAHDWNDGVVNPKPSCTQPGQETMTCLLCQETKTEPVAATGHKWDNACDTDCNICGEKREVTHDYSNDLSNDATGHWYSCNLCGEKKDFAAHTPGPEATESADQLCTVCEYVIASLKHTHQMSTEWVTNGDEHWHRCQVSGCTYVEDQEIHEFDNDCDVNCDICGYIRLAPPHNFSQDWQGGAEGHWHMCLGVACTARSEIYPHVPGPDATETEPQRCTECNIVIQMPLGHSHSSGNVWYSDDTQHWQCCADADCYEITFMESHQWNEGTNLTNGDVKYSCTVCGKETITAGETPPTAPSTVPTTPNPTVPNQGNGGNGGFPWQWIGIAAIALLLIGIILLIVEFIRSRKINSHGKYSK